MKLDGSEKTKVSIWAAERLSIVGEWIYYYSFEQYFKVKIDGTNEHNLYELIEK